MNRDRTITPFRLVLTLALLVITTARPDQGGPSSFLGSTCYAVGDSGGALTATAEFGFLQPPSISLPEETPSKQAASRGANPKEYAFCGGNPVNRRDPFGLESWEEYFSRKKAEATAWGMRNALNIKAYVESSPTIQAAYAFGDNMKASLETGGLTLARAATLGLNDNINELATSSQREMGLSKGERTALNVTAGGAVVAGYLAAWLALAPAILDVGLGAVARAEAIAFNLGARAVASTATLAAPVAARAANQGSVWYHQFMTFFRGLSPARLKALQEEAGKRNVAVIVQPGAAASFDAASKAITLSSRSSAVEAAEEMLHLMQARGEYGLSATAQQLADLRVKFPWYTPEMIARTADEINAKSFLLQRAEALELGFMERWVLGWQLDRLSSCGIHNGY